MFQKTYVIARLPQLRRLEGEEITKTRLIQAQQDFDLINSMLEDAIKEERVKEATREKSDTDYTPEYRNRIHNEME